MINRICKRVVVLTSVFLLALLMCTVAEAKKHRLTGPVRLVVANIDQTNMSDAAALFRRAGAKVKRTTSLKINPDNYDGLIIPGSNHDVHPRYYGQKVTRAHNLDRRWDIFRFKMIRKFVLAGKPVYGICGGCQSINVLFGGTLKQHIDGHRGAWLKTKISKKSINYRLFGSGLTTYHYHHECPKKVAPGFVATEWAHGNIEALQHKKYPIYGVQYHPEFMGSDGIKIARKFMSVCLKYRKKPFRVKPEDFKFIHY